MGSDNACSSVSKMLISKVTHQPISQPIVSHSLHFRKSILIAHSGIGHRSPEKLKKHQKFLKKRFSSMLPEIVNDEVVSMIYYPSSADGSANQIPLHLFKHY